MDDLIMVTCRHSNPAEAGRRSGPEALRAALLVAFSGMCLALPSIAYAQTGSEPAPPSGQAPLSGGAADAPASQDEDVEALLERLRGQIDRINEASRKRDEALDFLEKQVEAASGQLGATGRQTESLRDRTLELEDTLDTIALDRERLSEELSSAVDARDQMIADLEARLAARETRIAGLEAELEASRSRIAELDTRTAALEAREDELESLLAGNAESLKALETREQSLLVRIADLEGEKSEILESRTELEGELFDRDQSLGTLEAELVALQKTLGVRDEEVTRFGAALGTREAERDEALVEARRLAGLLSSTREELKRAADALEISQDQISSQEIEIAYLGQQLNAALVEKVEELALYRSEFFGRLRDALGDRPDVRIVGDRFVLQSELLFASGSADLGERGRAELDNLANTLTDVASRIPADIEWILRVDGHTDRVPVNPNARFASNWELSTERAIAVVEYLVRAGISPDRLAATGFGEYQPIDPRDDEIAYRRNRRIEFKLTER